MSKELGTLVIVVLKAQHLIDNHTFYKQDPYVKLSLSGATKQTPVDPKGGQHPVWDAELRFPISRDPSKNNRTLTISVFSEEKKDDELLGEGTVDITDTLKSGEFDGAPPFSLPSCYTLNIEIDWAPLSLKGTQRGEVYLEMTFFAAGPAPLTRRPSKFTNPSERLSQPQQPVSQRPQQRVVSQPSPSLLSPGGQVPLANSPEGSRQVRPKVQQVPLPGRWPGPSAQQHQSTLPPAPSHPNRQSSNSEDAPLPSLPQDVGPKEEFVPSILRPGGPSHPVVHPIQERHAVPQDAPAQQRYPAGTPSPPFTNGTAGHHHTAPNEIGRNNYPTHPHTHQTTLPLPDSLASHAHIHSSSSRTQPHPQPDARQPSHSPQGMPENVRLPPGGRATTQPYPQAQPELNHAQYHSQSQSPPQEWQQVRHSPRQQTPSPVGQQGQHPSPYPPHNHPAQPHVATLGSTLHGQSYIATPSPPPSHPYVASQTPSPPALSRITTQSPLPLLNAQPYAAHSAGPSHGPSVPPAQSYVSSTILAPPVRPPSQPTTHSPHVQPYISPANTVFPLPTSPPPMHPYGPSYAPAPAPSFPTPSFPIPQTPVDYFGAPPAAAAATFSPRDEPELPDPYLLRRYQTPLPLPPGISQQQLLQGGGPDPNARQKPKPSPPVAAPAMAGGSTGRDDRRDENERTVREWQRQEEERARARREQEERDAELARTLDLELNMVDRDGHGRSSSSSHLPPLRAGTAGKTMPGEW